jgi:hypothetical protein
VEKYIEWAHTIKKGVDATWVQYLR